MENTCGRWRTQAEFLEVLGVLHDSLTLCFLRDSFIWLALAIVLAAAIYAKEGNSPYPPKARAGKLCVGVMVYVSSTVTLIACSRSERILSSEVGLSLPLKDIMCALPALAILTVYAAWFLTIKGTAPLYQPPASGRDL
jgi:hypothetical protein